MEEVDTSESAKLKSESWIIEVECLVELSLLKEVVLGGKVCRMLVDFVLRCKVWFSQ